MRGVGSGLQASSSPEHPSRAWGEGTNWARPPSPPRSHPRRPVLTWGGGVEKVRPPAFPSPASPVLNVDTGWYFCFAVGWGKGHVLCPWHSHPPADAAGPSRTTSALRMVVPSPASSLAPAPGEGASLVRWFLPLLYNWPAGLPGLSTRTLPLHRMSVELCSD